MRLFLHVSFPEADYERPRLHQGDCSFAGLEFPITGALPKKSLEAILPHLGLKNSDFFSGVKSFLRGGGVAGGLLAHV